MPWNSLKSFGTLYIFSIPFTVFGLIFTVLKLFSKKEKNEPLKYGTFLTLCVFLMGVFVGLLTREVNINRANIIWYPMMIFTTLGAYEICRRVKIFTILLATIYLISGCGFANSYFRNCHKFFEGFGESLHAVEEYDWDKIYVTSHLHEHYWDAQVSEILTLFHHQIDAEYLQGKTNGNSQTPYSERYSYVDLTKHPIDPNENAVYVFNELEIDRFDEVYFVVHDYGEYCAAIPRHLADGSN